jgi:hypothetical protein
MSLISNKFKSLKVKLMHKYKKEKNNKKKSNKTKKRNNNYTKN